MPIHLLLKCHNVEETNAFYSEILGFSVSDSAEGTCTVEKEDGVIIFTEENLGAGIRNAQEPSIFSCLM